MGLTEAEILGNLDLGREKKPIGESVSDVLTGVVQLWLDDNIEESKQILRDKGRLASGSTIASINALPVFVSNGKGKVVVNADETASYVDRGVMGVNGSPFESPYSFKTARPSKAMVDAIQKWIPFKGYGLPQGINSFKSFSYAIATNVKKRGIKPTGFISDVFNDESVESLSSLVLKTMSKEILFQLKSDFK